MIQFPYGDNCMMFFADMENLLGRYKAQAMRCNADGIVELLIMAEGDDGPEDVLVWQDIEEITQTKLQ